MAGHTVENAVVTNEMGSTMSFRSNIGTVGGGDAPARACGGEGRYRTGR